MGRVAECMCTMGGCLPLHTEGFPSACRRSLISTALSSLFAYAHDMHHLPPMPQAASLISPNVGPLSEIISRGVQMSVQSVSIRIHSFVRSVSLWSVLSAKQCVPREEPQRIRVRASEVEAVKCKKLHYH